MKNSQLIIIDEITNTIYTEKINMVQGNQIETTEGIYTKEEHNYTRFYNEDNEGLTYVMNLDIPAKTEAENLKKLRRSVAINNAFNYQKKKGMDTMTMLLVGIIMMMIIFGG